MTLPPIDDWLRRFALDEGLHGHTAEVVLALPDAVRHDLMADSAFRMFVYEWGPGVEMRVGELGPNLSCRSVGLRRALARRPQPFIRYVIAHELAHAHLRNAGRHEEEDPEDAADSLAAEWGFPKPTR